MGTTILEPEEDGIKEDGPKLRLCTERERAFILHYVRHGNEKPWSIARQAGYAGDEKTLQVAASKVLGRRRVKDAIAECLAQRLRELGPMALASVATIAADPGHRKCLDACKLVVEALDIMPRRTVDINHHHTLSIEQLRARALELLRDEAIEIEAEPVALLPAPDDNAPSD